MENRRHHYSCPCNDCVRQRNARRRRTADRHADEGRPLPAGAMWYEVPRDHPIRYADDVAPSGSSPRFEQTARRWLEDAIRDQQSDGLQFAGDDGDENNAQPPKRGDQELPHLEPPIRYQRDDMEQERERQLQEFRRQQEERRRDWERRRDQLRAELAPNVHLGDEGSDGGMAVPPSGDGSVPVSAEPAPQAAPMPSATSKRKSRRGFFWLLLTCVLLVVIVGAGALTYAALASSRDGPGPEVLAPTPDLAATIAAAVASAWPTSPATPLPPTMTPAEPPVQPTATRMPMPTYTVLPTPTKWPAFAPLPTPSSIPAAGDFLQVSAGGNHTCAVRTDGRVACWGDNQYGQATPPAGHFQQVSAGARHTCGLQTGGSVVCWGSNHALSVEYRGQTIAGEYVGQSTPPEGTFLYIDTGAFRTCGVNVDGHLLCWGAAKIETSPHLGISRPSDRQPKMPSGTFQNISTGPESYSCGVRTNDRLECWATYVPDPPPSGTFQEVGVGSWHSCGLQTDGRVICWVTAFTNNDAPFSYSTPPLGTFKSISVGPAYTCGVKADHRVVCWGNQGGLSFGDFVPDYGQATPPAGSFRQVDAGSAHACGVKVDGSIVCWGSNKHGKSTPP